MKIKCHSAMILFENVDSVFPITRFDGDSSLPSRAHVDYSIRISDRMTCSAILH